MKTPAHDACWSTWPAAASKQQRQHEHEQEQQDGGHCRRHYCDFQCLFNQHVTGMWSLLELL